MPMKDISIRLEVGQDDGSGKPLREFATTYRVPANGQPGLTIADPLKLKIGTAVEKLGDLIDRDRSDL
jgi:hypothetical protein